MHSNSLCVSWYICMCEYYSLVCYVNIFRQTYFVYLSFASFFQFTFECDWIHRDVNVVSSSSSSSTASPTSFIVYWAYHHSAGVIFGMLVLLQFLPPGVPFVVVLYGWGIVFMLPILLLFIFQMLVVSSVSQSLWNSVGFPFFHISNRSISQIAWMQHWWLGTVAFGSRSSDSLGCIPRSWGGNTTTCCCYCCLEEKDFIKIHLYMIFNFLQ